MKMKITISLALIAIIATGVATYLVFNNNHNYTSKKIVVKKELKKAKNTVDITNENIVFLGDSITEIYPISDIFGDLPIVKSGVSGYKTTDILDRMDSMVYRYNPTRVFILIGTNDYLNDKPNTNEEIITNIKKIITNIKNNRQKAKIYLESVYPVNRNMNKEMVANRDNQTIMALNEQLKNYCNSNDVTYINTYSELIDEDGNFAKKYTYDGLHPSTLGYAKISTILTQYLYDLNKK